LKSRKKIARIAATLVFPQSSDDGERENLITVYQKDENKMPTLTKSRKEPFKVLLLKKRSELLAEVKRGPEALATNIQSPDAVEFAIKAAEQDLTARTADLRSQMLKEIDRALERVARGEYGTCESCEQEIAPARLKAIPWARYCVSCQEIMSRN
jgi:DnaK suppressor protein